MLNRLVISLSQSLSLNKIYERTFYFWYRVIKYTCLHSMYLSILLNILRIENISFFSILWWDFIIFFLGRNIKYENEKAPNLVEILNEFKSSISKQCKWVWRNFKGNQNISWPFTNFIWCFDVLYNYELSNRDLFSFFF